MRSINPPGWRSRWLIAFVAFQIVLITAIGSWAAVRVRRLADQRRLPPLRDEPLRVEPLYDYDVVVTDEQLERVLVRLGLQENGRDTNIGFVDHSLRFWGPEARFSNTQVMSGEDLRSLLTDHRRYAEVYGREQDPLLIDTGTGVRVRAFEGPASSSHIDHTMACLAEVGTPLDFPVFTDRRQTTFRDLVEQSLHDFSLNQAEYEWSALTYALLLPPTRRWLTAEGREMTFDRLAERIMREPLPEGVCMANHRFHTLVMFLRVDDQIPILSSETRLQVIAYLSDITARLVAHQHADGFWNVDWPHSIPASSHPSDRAGDGLDDRMIVTGHALEWWALAPREVHPPRHVLAAGGQWLVTTIDQLEDEQLAEFYSFLTHVGRALSLWRSRDPAEVVRVVQLRQQQSAPAPAAP